MGSSRIPTVGLSYRFVPVTVGDATSSDDIRDGLLVRALSRPGLGARRREGGGYCKLDGQSWRFMGSSWEYGSMSTTGYRFGAVDSALACMPDVVGSSPVCGAT